MQHCGISTKYLLDIGDRKCVIGNRHLEDMNQCTGNANSFTNTHKLQVEIPLHHVRDEYYKYLQIIILTMMATHRSRVKKLFLKIKYIVKIADKISSEI